MAEVRFHRLNILITAMMTECNSKAVVRASSAALAFHLTFLLPDLRPNSLLVHCAVKPFCLLFSHHLYEVQKQ